MTFPTLCLMRDAAIDDPSGFAPEGRIVIAYLTFFACGWLLWRNADVLSELRRFPRAPILLMVGVVGALLGYSIWYWQHSTGIHMLLGLLASAWFLALAMWLFIFGFIGIFLRLFERPIPWFRYLSDSSYWLYLVHMPVLLAFQIAVTETRSPPAGPRPGGRGPGAGAGSGGRRRARRSARSRRHRPGAGPAGSPPGRAGRAPASPP